MCGICGIWNRDGRDVDPEILVQMRDSMAHRGPDGAGCILFDANGEAGPVQFVNVSELADGRAAVLR